MGNTISQNKVTSGVIGAACLTAGVFFWKSYQSYVDEQSDQPKAELQQKSKPRSIQEEINQLKTQIDTQNPSFEDVKKVLTVMANYVKGRTLELSDSFKAQRRKRFPHEQRINNMGDYFRFTSEGLMDLQNTIMKLQAQQGQFMTQLNLNQAKMVKYAGQLQPFMQELVFSNDISLQDVKKSIVIKTEYLQTHGERIVQELIELSATISLQEKQIIPLFLNVIISDEAFEHEPSLDKEEFDMAYQKYKSQINPELIRLEKVIMPLMGRLQTALMGDQMGGLGGMGGAGGYEGYGGYPQEYQGDMGYGSMGGPMGGPMGMNQQMIHQQLEQLRQSDPEGYNQLMQMMQAQMGR